MDASSIQRLGALISGIRFAMLTCRGRDGLLHSRPLTVQNRALDERDPALWLFVARDSELVGEIAADAAVNLAFADLDGDRYVSIAGSAQRVDDAARVRELWSPMAKAWFPGGPEDARLQLLRVPVEQAEYWDVKASKLVQLVKMATAVAAGRTPHALGEHRELR